MIENPLSEILSSKDSLFKSTAYDIRAYVGEPGAFFTGKAVLTPEAARVAGALMGSVEFALKNGEMIRLLPGDAVVIGYDNGPTSAVLAKAFATGLIEQGVNVYDVGLASSGQVYHNETQLGAQGYVQITRSHVEVTSNGAKFGIGGNGIHTYLLGQMNRALDTAYGRNVLSGKIFDKAQEGYQLYTDKMIARYGGYFAANRRKVAVNLFGGTGVKYKELFKRILGSDLVILGDTINVNDGSMLADPTRREMLERVPELKKVLSNGIRVHSFDLDADRGALTEGDDALLCNSSGHYLGDDIAYIIADYKLTQAVPELLSKLSRMNIQRSDADLIHKIVTTVYVDPRYSSGIAAYVQARGGRTEYHRKGHSLWKETMTANMAKVARLAGFSSPAEFALNTGYCDMQIEASLHLFCTDPDDAVPRDDAVENVFIIERILDSLGITSLKDYFSKISRRFTTKEIRTNALSNYTKEAVTASVINTLKQVFTGSRYSMVEFDGQLRVDWDTGFIMYGMSNTSPKLTFMAEGSTIDERNEALAYILALHNNAKKLYGDDLPMDIGENGFFINDPSYGMSEPDTVTLNAPQALLFMKKMKIVAA